MFMGGGWGRGLRGGGAALGLAEWGEGNHYGGVLGWFDGGRQKGRGREETEDRGLLGEVG